jgi:cytosine/adenosine deaminase-related metal-dependent hydrolase
VNSGGKVKRFTLHSVNTFAFLLLILMGLRKFIADHLFTGTEMLDHSNVLITNKPGYIQEIVNEKDAGEGIERFEGILSPGFINCHCHLELSHMKGLIPERTGLVDFVFKVVTQRHIPNEEILNAIQKAEIEMLENGIVAVGDICNNTTTLPQKLKGKLAYYNFVEASGWLPSVAEQRFQWSKDFYDAFSAHFPSTSLVPHAPYSVSDSLWQHIQPYFENKVASIHNQETTFEDEFFMKGTGDFCRMYQLMDIDNTHHAPSGKTSLQSYFKKMNKADTVLLVHNTCTSAEDIEYAQFAAYTAGQSLYWCLCVNANQYIESALPAIDSLNKKNAEIVLGTDSLASNYSLSILDEMKTIRKNFPSISTGEMLQWSTLNGAKALKMDNTLGSFEKGKQPGVICLSTDLMSVQRLL